MANPPKRINPTLNQLSMKCIPWPSITAAPAPAPTTVNLSSPTPVALPTRKRLPLQRRSLVHPRNRQTTPHLFRHHRQLLHSPDLLFIKPVQGVIPGVAVISLARHQTNPLPAPPKTFSFSLPLQRPLHHLDSFRHLLPPNPQHLNHLHILCLAKCV